MEFKLLVEWRIEENKNIQQEWKKKKRMEGKWKWG